MLRVVELLLEKAGLSMSGEEALGKLERVMVEQAEAPGLRFRLRPDLTPEQKAIFAALGVPEPPRVEPLVPTPSSAVT
jgi:hypothetical protein